MNLIPFAQACSASYDPTSKPFAQDPGELTHLFLSSIDGLPCFTFEGTTDEEEWLFRDFLVIGITTFHHSDYGPVHDGIAKGALGVCDAIDAYLRGLGYPSYYLTGHSKGAGETLIASAEMKSRGHPPKFFAAFEGPHVGTARLAAWLHDVLGVETATNNCHGRDLVTQVPWSTPLLHWQSAKPRQVLTVPDSYDLATKHRIPAVLDALAAA